MINAVDHDKPLILIGATIGQWMKLIAVYLWGGVPARKT